jgi:hypothetical protein
MNHPGLQTAMAHCGLIAILRGIKPAEAEAIGQELYAAGFRLIEVPLNSPDPLDSIRAMRAALPTDCLIGAGTVLDPEDCARVQQAGGELIVMPHSDAAVIRARRSRWRPWAASRPTTSRFTPRRAPAASAWAPPCTNPACRPPKSARTRAHSSRPGNAPIPPRRPKHEDHQAHHLHRAAAVVLPED